MLYAGWVLSPGTVISLNSEVKIALETLARAGSTAQRVARRWRVILLAAQGTPNRAIARQVGVSRPTVLSVRNAFAQGGVEALRRDPVRQRSRHKLRPALEKQLIETTLHTPPPRA